MTAAQYVKNMRGNWQGKTSVALAMPGPQRRLDITTLKVCSGNLITSALVCEVQDSVTTYTPYDDFSKRLEISDLRVTEKAVRLQHERALAQLDTLVAEVKAFYAAKQLTADAGT
jgi:hypothetical protein